VKIGRFAHCGRSFTGVVEGPGVRPLDGSIAEALTDVSGALERAAGAEELPLDEVEFLPPVDPTARVFCVAQNYASHAQEQTGAGVAPTPIIFFKPVSALIGHGADVALRPLTSFLDYEAELAVVIGADAREIDERDARGVIFGGTCLNDVTARALQPAVLGDRPQTDWFSAKSLDRSSPVGPWLVSLDELGNPSDLGVRCRVNGQTVQDDRTSSMARSVETLIAFISQRVALRPGDLVATGTPAGIGRARGVSLQPGDVVEVEVEGVGRLRNTVVAPPPG